ncbi:redox-sensing transcriptional repressor Rex, partial [Actinoplanes sp. NPDC051633]|uniref:redox-sensing transcriptional repressor Rex n=1 Tax=Actinoplanes sp. NPDC051633 TaxID=3155670 RepID=UPI003423E8A9
MSQQRYGNVPGAPGGPAFPDLPEATIARLPEYLRALHNLADASETISSEGLAAAAGVNSAKLRKDLSHLGSYGTRGVGYDVRLLTAQIEYILGLDQHRAVCLVGVGNLGHALAGYDGFAGRGFRIVALFDADPARVGEVINGLTVQHIEELARVAAEESIAIAVIATPAGAAQAVTDDLVAAGVTSILNFAPCVLTV